MMCDRCDRPLAPEESVPYTIPGATGPGITITVHREPCLPPSPRPKTYSHPSR